MAKNTKRGRRIMDPAEREAFVATRREEERERIADAVRELTTSEGWRRWLDTRSRFHNYSVGNCLLIALQRPDASYVASYRTWQSLGRQVRRGEHGIRIMAPMTVRVRERASQPRDRVSSGATVAQAVAAQRTSIYDAPSGEAESSTRLLFKSVPVFDVGQTDGEPLPELPHEPIEGDSLAEYLPALEAFARELGGSVEYRPVESGALGFHDPRTHAIVVESRLAPNAQVRVLVHELAHALGVSYDEYPRDVAEVIVESAALIVCGTLGLDTSGESVPYIAGWSQGDPKALREYAAKVDELATRIERAAGIKGGESMAQAA